MYVHYIVYNYHILIVLRVLINHTNQEILRERGRMTNRGYGDSGDFHFLHRLPYSAHGSRWSFLIFFGLISLGKIKSAAKEFSPVSVSSCRVYSSRLQSRLLYRIGQNILHKRDIEYDGTGGCCTGGTSSGRLLPPCSAVVFHKRYVSSVA